MSVPRQVAVTQQLVAGLLRDGQFMREFPEFAAVRTVVVSQPAAKPGCSKCQKNKPTTDGYLHFTNVLRSLTGNRLAAIKAFLQADQLQLTITHRQAGIEHNRTTTTI